MRIGVFKMKHVIIMTLIGLASSSVCLTGSYNPVCNDAMIAAGISDPTGSYSCGEGGEATRDLALKRIVDDNSGFCCNGGLVEYKVMIVMIVNQMMHFVQIHKL